MNIKPLNGLGDLRFGIFKRDIKKLLGDPSEIENQDYADEVSSEIWRYETLGVALYFEKDSGDRLWGITTTSRQVSLQGVNPIGLTDKELVDTFPSLILDVNDRGFKEYSYPNNEIDFILKDGIVKRIDINPNLEKYSNEFPDKYN